MDMESKTISNVTSMYRHTCTAPVGQTGDTILNPGPKNLLRFPLKFPGELQGFPYFWFCVHCTEELEVHMSCNKENYKGSLILGSAYICTEEMEVNISCNYITSIIPVSTAKETQFVGIKRMISLPHVE